jgi:non-specific serine/threonine protein kinase
LDYLALLLRNPGREFHVMELVGQVMGKSWILGRAGRVTEAWQGASDTGPLLDPRAKADYRQRFADLRIDLEEAERFNNAARAERARNEMATVATQLASAVGLGGRDRKTCSDAERARSAVTKRIKDSINRISEVVPSLRRHLAVRVKTGYFCSYNPHPERPVAWRF